MRTLMLLASLVVIAGCAAAPVRLFGRPDPTYPPTHSEDPLDCLAVWETCA